MFTDIVGYTALMAESEQTGLAVRERHRALLGRLAGRCQGQIVDENGDELVLSFPSALDAVSCALAAQAELRGDPDLKLRIGIHLGDVIFDEGRVYGDGVNVASRIRPFAAPGGICVSQPVYDSVKNQPDLQASSLGPQQLKNVARPLEIFAIGEGVVAPVHAKRRGSMRLALAAAALAVVAAVLWATWPFVPNEAELPAGPNFAGRPAIAVLPFDNMSPDPEQAFFADGLAEDLITRLASWRAFPVIARNSSFQYRGGDLDLKRVGAELGADYLVEGSVRRGGNRIRVTAQLIDATSSEHVWAESYDRAISDLFSMQDEISSTIAASLVGDLTRAERHRAQLRGTEDLEAWSLYQLGMHHLDRYTADDAREAARLFERAVSLDPHFSTGFARLAMTNWMSQSGDGSQATPEQLEAAFENARRAVALDPRDPVAHAALGATHLTAGDPKRAVDATRQAVELNPSMPEAWIWLGWAQLAAGNPEACIVATERAQRLDPQGSMVWIWDSLGLAYWEVGRFEDSLEAGRRLVATHPSYFTGYLYVAMSAASLGRLDEARAAIADGRRVRPDLSIALMQNYLAVSRPEADARRDAALRKAGLD
jgi:adenylate cyclase